MEKGNSGNDGFSVERVEELFVVSAFSRFPAGEKGM